MATQLMDLTVILLLDQTIKSHLLPLKMRDFHSKQYNLRETLHHLIDEANPYFIPLWKLDVIREKSFILDVLEDSFRFVSYTAKYIFASLQRNVLDNLVRILPFHLKDKSLENAAKSFNRLFVHCSNLKPLFNPINIELFESQVLNQNRIILNQIYEMLLNDRKCAKRLLDFHPTDFEFLSEKLKADKSFVLETIPKYSNCIKYASEELRNDKQVILRVLVGKNGLLLEFASEALRNDREIVLRAIEGEKIGNSHLRIPSCHDMHMNNALALQFASPQLRNDREIVSKAIIRNALAIQFASEELRNDRILVSYAVQRNASVLDFVSEELRKDEKIIELAAKARFADLDMD